MIFFFFFCTSNWSQPTGSIFLPSPGAGGAGGILGTSEALFKVLESQLFSFLKKSGARSALVSSLLRQALFPPSRVAFGGPRSALNRGLCPAGKGAGAGLCSRQPGTFGAFWAGVVRRLSLELWLGRARDPPRTSLLLNSSTGVRDSSVPSCVAHVPSAWWEPAPPNPPRGRRAPSLSF